MSIWDHIVYNDCYCLSSIMMRLCLTCHHVLTKLTYARHSLLCLLLILTKRRQCMRENYWFISQTALRTIHSKTEIGNTHFKHWRISHVALWLTVELPQLKPAVLRVPQRPCTPTSTTPTASWPARRFAAAQLRAVKPRHCCCDRSASQPLTVTNSLTDYLVALIIHRWRTCHGTKAQCNCSFSKDVLPTMESVFFFRPPDPLIFHIPVLICWICHWLQTTWHDHCCSSETLRNVTKDCINWFTAKWPLFS